jgi:transcriptional regulator with XRE-family HTH domain
MDDAESIKARIRDASGATGEDWLDEACRMLEAYRNRLSCKRVYDATTIGNRIRIAREAAGLTQRELAFRIGVHPRFISGWENGRLRLPARKIPGLCMSLGVKRGWLLFFEETGGPKLRNATLRRQRTPREERMIRSWKSWKLEAAKVKARELNAARRSSSK